MKIKIAITPADAPIIEGKLPWKTGKTKYDITKESPPEITPMK